MNKIEIKLSKIGDILLVIIAFGVIAVIATAVILFTLGFFVGGMMGGTISFLSVFSYGLCFTIYFVFIVLYIIGNRIKKRADTPRSDSLQLQPPDSSTNTSSQTNSKNDKSRDNV